MKIYHQTGFRYNWNIESFVDDHAGDGLILSPININSDKITRLSDSVRQTSWLDPQLYLLKDYKKEMESYEYFPLKIKSNFDTDDFSAHSDEVAGKCLQFQIDNDFEYAVIPMRYLDNIPANYYEQWTTHIVEPFINKYNQMGTSKKLLITVIVKQIQLQDKTYRNELLNFLTSIEELSGVYLIFEHNFTSKQIKDTQYLYDALLFIHYLKMNSLEVHIGYANTEGILYSIANPDSISMGSYENLRHFNIKRFRALEKNEQAAPRARLYIGKLYQWVDYGYLEAIRTLYSKYQYLIDTTKYNVEMFEPTYNWHFQKPSPYKHFFIVYSNQVKQLPEVMEERISYLLQSFNNALNLYGEILDSGVLLDSNSDGSHLNFWLTTINMFNKYREENASEF